MPNSRTNNNNSETRSESLAPPLMDVNGSCSSNGIDITFYVSYLKGIQPALLSCADCPPVGQLTAPAPTMIPVSAPNLKTRARSDADR